MYKVLAPKSCKDSAETLEAYMNNMRNVDEEVRINWGFSAFNNPKNVNYKGNLISAVTKSVNKWITFNELGLFCVPLVKTKEDFNDTAVQHTVEGGMAGKGVRLVHPAADKFDPDILTTKFIEGDEFRVYFAYGKVLGIAQKAKLYDKAHPWIKTPDNGWGYSMIHDEPVTGLFDLFADGVNEVTKKIGLKYGAVDLIMEKGTCITYILEVNSAPCLFDSKLAESMAQAIVDNEEI